MSALEPLVLRPGAVALADLRRIAAAPVRLALPADARPAVEAAAATVAGIVDTGQAVYGVNTGFGKLAQTRVERERLAHLQTNLVLSHAAGTGPLLDDATVRLALALKVFSLARGHSGVRWSVIEALLGLLDREAYPCVPAKGSVGASGDLAPLAHMAAALLGVGEVRIAGRRWPAADGLRRAGLAPITLGPKEGLALLNGTQVSTALALQGLFAAEDVFAAAVLTGAMAVDAALGSDTPFDARIQRLSGHPGQIDVAAAYRALIAGSAIRRSHADCGRVQDPYSLRCQPQVMGACLDQMRHAARILAVEANAVSDNPLVFADDGAVLSGGNFHAEPVALAADVLALAIAETGSLSERRIALLTDGHISGLPPFLVADAGINSGFMIAHVTAAALAAENKALAHPASVDSLPTSANQEDHVSMATHAARRLLEMADNAAGIVAVELLAAAQGIEFRRPLVSAPALEAALAALRAKVPRLDADRYMAPDLAAAKMLVVGGTLAARVPLAMPSQPPSAPADDRPQN